MRNATFLIIGLALLFGACQSPTEPEAETNLSQDLGAVLTEPIMRQTNLVWSPDSREIFYVSASPEQLRAVDVQSQSTRIVEAIYQGYLPYGTSYDGKYFYYIAQDNFLYRLALNGQNIQRVLSNVSYEWRNPKRPMMALSPDNLHLAYMTARGRGDSLFLYNTVSRSKKYYTRGQPVCFSPDGSQLLLRRNFMPHDTLCILSLGNGNVQTILVRSTSLEIPTKNIRWSTEGIQLLLYEISSFSVQNLSSNATRPLTINDRYTWLGSIAWSATGNKFAVWSNECIKGSSWSSCDVEGYRLHLTTLGASGTSLIAHGQAPGSADGAGNVMAFSPDNKKIAYVFNQQIYLKGIP